MRCKFLMFKYLHMGNLLTRKHFCGEVHTPVFFLFSAKLPNLSMFRAFYTEPFRYWFMLFCCGGGHCSIFITTPHVCITSHYQITETKKKIEKKGPHACASESFLFVLICFYVNCIHTYLWRRLFI